MSSSRKSSGQVFGPIDGVATGGHPGERGMNGLDREPV